MCALRDWFGNGGNLEQNNKLKPFNCQHIGVGISEFTAKLAKVIEKKTNYLSLIISPGLGFYTFALSTNHSSNQLMKNPSE
jgi:hypothetical protein